MRAGPGSWLVAMALALVSALPAMAQQRDVGDPPLRRSAPFNAGEKAEYQVKLGGISVGSGVLEVVGMEEVAGFDTYRTRMHIRGGIPLARVDTRLESWLDVDGLFSRRFEQDQHELRFQRYRMFDFYPESGSYRRRDSGEVGRLPTRRPLDDISFLFYARALPLRVGDRYTIPRYFQESGNPVILDVLRRETITVPAGTFETIVVQPTIRTEGIFGQGGEAELYFTDDDRRALVYMRSRVPLVGSLTMSLREYDPGDGVAD